VSDVLESDFAGLSPWPLLVAATVLLPAVGSRAVFASGALLETGTPTLAAIVGFSLAAALANAPTSVSLDLVDDDDGTPSVRPSGTKPSVADFCVPAAVSDDADWAAWTACGRIAGFWLWGGGDGGAGGVAGGEASLASSSHEANGLA
jgi:hypothetical protein